MKPHFSLTILFLIFLQCLSVFYSSAQESGNAKITFVLKEGDNAKTYIGRLTKGDINSLRGELQRYNSGGTNEVDVDDKKRSEEGYVDRIVIGGKTKNKKKLNKAAHDDLFGNYEVTDQKSLKEVKEKKQKVAAKKALAKDNSGNYKKYISARNRKQTPQLSKYFKISNGRMLRDGRTIKKPAGSVALIVTYKIREGRTINTYVNVVDEFLKSGSSYNLKYHGIGSKRKYYLEYVSAGK